MVFCFYFVDCFTGMEHVARMEEMRSAYKVVVFKPEARTCLKIQA
jgi:hypothetical protein